jgi:hypothetical protein
MLKTILLVVAVVVAALLTYAAFRPDNFRLARSTTVASSTPGTRSPRWSPPSC